MHKNLIYLANPILLWESNKIKKDILLIISLAIQSVILSIHQIRQWEILAALQYNIKNSNIRL